MYENASGMNHVRRKEREGEEGEEGKGTWKCEGTTHVWSRPQIREAVCLLVNYCCERCRCCIQGLHLEHLIIAPDPYLLV